MTNTQVVIYKFRLTVWSTLNKVAVFMFCESIVYPELLNSPKTNKFYRSCKFFAFKAFCCWIIKLCNNNYYYLWQSYCLKCTYACFFTVMVYVFLLEHHWIFAPFVVVLHVFQLSSGLKNGSKPLLESGIICRKCLKIKKCAGPQFFLNTSRHFKQLICFTKKKKNWK